MEQEKKPNFFIVGFPKCGTTSMSQYLSQHNDVFYAKCNQEPNYFNDDFNADYRKYNDEKRYLKDCYGGSEQSKIAGESSPIYIYSDTAIENIINYNPSAKFIVLLRNLPEWIFSYHKHMFFYGIQKEKDFDKAWASSANEKIEQYQTKGKDFFVDYKLVSKFSFFVEKLINQVGKEKILFITLDELKSDPATTYANTLNFLDLQNDQEITFDHFNKGTKDWAFPWLRHIAPRLIIMKRKLRIRKKFGLLKKIKVNTNAAKISPETKKYLEQYFIEETSLIYDLTGKKI